MVDAIVFFATRGLAAAPIAGVLALLVAIPANVAVMVGGTAFLLAYLFGWQRVESGAIPPHRLVVPALLALGTLTLAVLLSLLVAVDDPDLALAVALVGMAAAIAAVALAVRSAPPT